MTASNTITAIIADDEPLLRESLQRELSQAWPELHIVATASNGQEAIELVLAHKPNIVFLDIQMPGATGLEVAQTIAEDWPEDSPSRHAPLVVFATAFDHYAVEAFESAAADYLVKPVTQKRLLTAVQRLKKRLNAENTPNADDLAKQLSRLINQDREPTRETITPPLLQRIQAGSGDQIRIIPIDDVILFESADKYISVHTVQGESLIREPLKKLLPQLDPNKFEQIHRGAIVNMTKIKSAHRDETGKVTLSLNGIEKQAVVSRVFRHLFQAM